MTADRSTVLPIFLSFSKPVFPAQQEFIRNLSEGLESFGMKPRTLGVTVYGTGVPLNAIKDLMNNSLGLISVAFRRTHIQTGEKFDDSDGRVGRKEPLRDKWLTSPWPHIEVGMAFQIDLPILILRESGVVADGILEKGSSAFYLPTFDLDSSAQSYLFSDEWQHMFYRWSRQVKELAKTKKFVTTTDELPPTWNFLRMREAAENMQASGKSSSGSLLNTADLSHPQAGKAPASRNDIEVAYRFRARAEFDYEASEANEISFKEGEILTELQKIDPDWWVATNATGHTGLVPSNFVSEINERGDPL